MPELHYEVTSKVTQGPLLDQTLWYTACCPQCQRSECSRVVNADLHADSSNASVQLNTTSGSKASKRTPWTPQTQHRKHQRLYQTLMGFRLAL